MRFSMRAFIASVMPTDEPDADTEAMGLRGRRDGSGQMTLSTDWNSRCAMTPSLHRRSTIVTDRIHVENIVLTIREAAEPFYRRSCAHPRQSKSTLVGGGAAVDANHELLLLWGFSVTVFAFEFRRFLLASSKSARCTKSPKAHNRMLVAETART